MDKKLGIVVHRIFGMQAVNTFRQAFRETKEVQTMTDESMRSMLYQGDLIPHIEIGHLFKIKLTSRHSSILGLSSQYGPIVMRVTHAREVEVLMNAAVDHYYTKRLNKVTKTTSNIDVEMLAYLAMRGHHKEKWHNCPNIAQHMAEKEPH